MITPNIEEKLSTVCSKLNALRQVAKIDLDVQYAPCNAECRHVLPTACADWQPFVHPYYLFEQNKYYWFRAKFNVPKLQAHQKAYLCVETFIGGVASTIRPQGLLYLNGKEVCGIDINHTDVLLDGTGEYEMYLHFYTHVFGTGFPLYFSVKIRDERITQAYYDFNVPLSAVKLLNLRTNELVRSLTVLEKATNIVDFRNPYSEEFYVSVEQACDYLKREYYEALGGSFNTALCVGHTHIDVAWLWNLEQTRQKVERSFSTVLKLMDEYPEYRFMMSQPQLFAYLKQTDSELFARVKQRIQEGRWEVDGAMWLEADTNLTCGESLVRQMMYGQRFFRDEFGIDCTCVWLPDVFGYSGQLPQIMAKSGIKRFVTAKIGWNDTDRFPYDVFDWYGIDGSKVFAYLLSTSDTDPRNGVYDRTYTSYCEPLTAKSALGTWNRFQQKDFTDSVIMSYGYGDGGGGPTREDLERQHRLSCGLLGIPKTKISSLHEALDVVESNFRRSCEELRRVPKWHGELYFEFHRGTLTSVPRVKKNNRMAEIALINAEELSVMANKLCGALYPAEQIERNWKVALLNQFHDILPGSAVEAVYADSDKQYAELFAEVDDMVQNALQTIATNINANGRSVVFNNTPFTANGTVTLNGKTHIVRDISAHGYNVIDIDCSDRSCGDKVQVGDKMLQNSYYVLTFSNDGSVVNLLDKRNNRQIVPDGACINEFVAYEDMPFEYDNWEMAPYHKQKSRTLSENATFAPIDDGDRKGFEIVKKYGNSTITQRVWLYNDGIERIDFDTDVVWREKGQLLKVRFPLDVMCDNARYDIQFGSVLRSTHDNTSWDSARFESVAHKWVDMSEGDYGVALLNNGKYGFGTEDNVLTMTIVKSGSFPYDGASDVVPSFTYSLLPHAKDYTNGVVSAAYVLNNPFTVAKGGSGQLPQYFSLVSTNDGGLVCETVKKAECGKGTVVRVYEANGARHNATITFGVPVDKAFLCDLNEKEIQQLTTQNNGVNITIKPFEILTIKVL